MLAKLPMLTQFPDQAMVERELFEHFAAHAVNTTVAHMGHDRALGEQGEHAGGRAHVVEVDIRLPPLMDFRVCFLDGTVKCFGG